MEGVRGRHGDGGRPFEERLALPGSVCAFRDKLPVGRFGVFGSLVGAQVEPVEALAPRRGGDALPNKVSPISVGSVSEGSELH